MKSTVSLLAFCLTISGFAGPWDGYPEYDGWIHAEWFGFLYPVEDYILHAEHGWQYPFGTSAESLFLYDFGVENWAWTNNTIYPWLYLYGDVGDWFFYYRGASQGNRWFYDPRQDAFRNEADLRPAVFVPGPFTYHPVSNTGADPVTIEDAATGLVIAVPGNQSGELRVAPLTDGPPAPYPGRGYTIETEGLYDIQLLVQAEQVAEGDFPMVYTYASMQGAFDDAIGYRPRWIGLPFEKQPNGDYLFQFPIPEPPMAVSTFGLDSVARAAEPERPRHFFVSKISSTMPEAQQRLNVELQVAAYALDFANALSPATRTTVDTRRAREPLGIAYGANYYTGFNKLRAWSFGRSFQPFMQISSPLQTQALAHETGHYLTHLLVGDEAYDALEAAGGSVFSGNHGIRDVIGRANLLEDYAYFIESFLKGTGGNYNLDNPHITFRSLTPLTRDFPGMEGFAAHILTALKRNTPTMANYLGSNQSIAPLDLSDAQVFDIVAHGPLTVDTLRSQCEAALEGNDKTAFQTILGRMGWSYFIRGKLVDSENTPIGNARVRNILKIEDEVFIGGTTNLESKADGSFALTGEVFGGDSLLEVTFESGLVIDVPISIDWEKPTDKVIELGRIEVAEKENLSASVSLDYSNEQAFPPGFSVFMSAQLQVKVISGDASAVRVDIAEYLEYNTPTYTINIYGPPGSEVSITGPMTLSPSAISGADWTMQERSFAAIPDTAFSFQGTHSATLDTTIPITRVGLQGGASVISNGTFRSTEDGYLGRLSAMIRVYVSGE